MLLSIIVCGKNDNHRKNTIQTLKWNLEQTLHNMNNLGVTDVELVLCDWGSEVKITDAISLDTHNKNFKCVYVSPEVSSKYNGKASYSIVHSLNAAFRKTIGEYVIFWNSDCFVTEESFSKLYEFVNKMKKSNDLSFYWSSRYNISYEEYSSFETRDEVINYINNTELPREKMVNNSLEPFGGCGASILLNRDLWESSTGFWENLPYWGWQDIEFHNRLLMKYNYGGDIHDMGFKIYHFDYPRNFSFVNGQVSSSKFEANDSSWGLNNEIVEIY